MTIKSEFKIEDAPFPLTDVDKWILSQTDEEFKLHDWDDLKTIIGTPLPPPQDTRYAPANMSRSKQPIRSQADAIRAAQVHAMDD